MNTQEREQLAAAIAAEISQTQLTMFSRSPKIFANMVDIIARHLEASVLQQAPTEPTQGEGWLIEKGQLCLGSCSHKPAWVTFTDPTAVRFARKVDAENMLNGLRAMSDEGAFQNCTISDHAWMAAAPASVDQTRWISVTEKLPDVGGTYLVYAKAAEPFNYSVEFGHFFLFESGPAWMTGGSSPMDVSHWQPFPKKPVDSQTEKEK